MSPSLRACCVAELIGTFLLVFFGTGAVHVAVLFGDLVGLWQVGIVWGVAIMLAIFTIGPISGGHINPAISIALWLWGTFPGRRVMPYIVAQLVGAFAAAALLFALFSSYLAAMEVKKGVERGQPGSEITAMCYGEYYPNPAAIAPGDEKYNRGRYESLDLMVSTNTAFVAELIGTAILGFVVAFSTRSRNSRIAGNLVPVFIGLTVTVLICVIAPLTQACFNPARDLGPRLFAALVGWGEVAIPTTRGWGFLLVYVAGPIAGASAGMGLVDLLTRLEAGDRRLEEEKK